MPALIGWLCWDKIKGRRLCIIINGKMIFCDSCIAIAHTFRITESHIRHFKKQHSQTVNCHYVWRPPFFSTPKMRIWHIRRWCVKRRVFWPLSSKWHTCPKGIENIFPSIILISRVAKWISVNWRTTKILWQKQRAYKMHWTKSKNAFRPSAISPTMMTWAQRKKWNTIYFYRIR